MRNANKPSLPRFRSPSKKLVINSIFLLIGLGIFFAILFNIGIENVINQILELRWTLAIIVIIVGVSYVGNALAWRLILGPKYSINFFELLRIQIAGETLSTIAPAGFIGGDPLRIYLLKRYVPWDQGAASVIIGRTINIMSTVLMIIGGAFTALLYQYTLSTNILYALCFVIFLATTSVCLLIIMQRNGILVKLANALQRFKIYNFSPSVFAKIVNIDAIILEFYSKHPREFWFALLYNCVGRILSIVETYLLGSQLNSNFGLSEAIILSALAPTINLLFSFIPGAMGVMEGAFGFALQLFKMPSSVGLTIQIAKRIRSAIWILIGYTLTVKSRKYRDSYPSTTFAS